jgi:1-acyl-sn-glycerol-3-phosphate acyltransferase
VVVAEYRLLHLVDLPAPAIYVAPHRSMFDIPLGIETFHRLGVSPLLVVSRSHLERLRAPVSDWDRLDLLPISRDGSGRRSLLEIGERSLARGRSVAIMPEGRVIRGPDSERHIRSGAAELAERASAPIVVLGSAGASAFWQRGRPATFANVRRKPVVVVAHHVLRPFGDLGVTMRAIATGLAAAECYAQDRLAKLAGGDR